MIYYLGKFKFHHKNNLLNYNFHEKQTINKSYLHNFKKKHNPSNAKMMANSDMMETVKICESLKNKSFVSYSMSLPILFEFMRTEFF